MHACIHTFAPIHGPSLPPHTRAEPGGHQRRHGRAVEHGAPAAARGGRRLHPGGRAAREDAADFHFNQSYTSEGIGRGAHVKPS